MQYVSSLRDFQSHVQTSGRKLVVVDFFATWCGPCRAIAPFYEQLSNQYSGRAIFLKVDVDQTPDVAQQCSVSAMPTFHMYKAGRRVVEFAGADRNRLQAEVQRHAPSSEEIAFASSGNRLGSSSAASASSSGQSAREIAAAAAAKRFQSAKPKSSSPSSSRDGKRKSKTDKVTDAIMNDANESAEAEEEPAPQNDPRLNVNPVFLEQMCNEMGFPKIRAEKALIITGNKSLERAIEWCFEHADDIDIDEPLQVVTKEGAPKKKLAPEEAKKKAEELYERARKKRAEEDKKEAIEREKNRLRSGKEVTAAKAKLEEENRRRAVEEKKREKREAMLEKQRIRQMLEADKQRRRERFNMPGAASSSRAAPAPTTRAPPSQPKASGGKIQFRMPDGSRVEGDFTAEQKMGDLVTFLQSKNPDLDGKTIKFSQQYPRKTYSSSDYETALGELKLLPRGALTVSF